MPEDDEPRMCNAVVFYGSHNPDSANFGPDEYCENDAEPDSDYCAGHDGSDYDGEDY